MSSCLAVGAVCFAIGLSIGFSLCLVWWCKDRKEIQEALDILGGTCAFINLHSDDGKKTFATFDGGKQWYFVKVTMNGVLVSQWLSPKVNGNLIAFLNCLKREGAQDVIVGQL